MFYEILGWGLVGAGTLLFVFFDFIKSQKVRVKNSIVYGPGFVYKLTQDDLLWLARAIFGETGEIRRGGEAVAWALIQNFSLIKSERYGLPRYSSFVELIRAYCQPVNPEWMDKGSEKCQLHQNLCTDDLIARRRRISSMAWDDIPESIRITVILWARGDIPNPVPGMVDWSAHNFNGAQKFIGGNWFGVVRGRRLV